MLLLTNQNIPIICPVVSGEYRNPIPSSYWINLKLANNIPLATSYYNHILLISVLTSNRFFPFTIEKSHFNEDMRIKIIPNSASKESQLSDTEYEDHCAYGWLYTENIGEFARYLNESQYDILTKSSEHNNLVTL